MLKTTTVGETYFGRDVCAKSTCTIACMNTSLLRYYVCTLEYGLHTSKGIQTPPDVNQIFRARKDFGAVVTKFEQYSDEIAKLETDDPTSTPFIEV